MSRNLASIQTIKELLPIDGADAIELAVFENIGWKCVVKKGEFAPGQKAVYFEIDSLLPLKPEFEFLSRQGVKRTVLEDGTTVEGYRLKTVKLRGQLSQGLALPVEAILPSNTRILFNQPQINWNYFDGQDVSDILGIHKYEPPVNVQLSGTVKGNFPSFIPKTDETRVQTCWNIVQKYKDLEWYAALKYDGTSCTIYKHQETFGVCSRNLDLTETEGSLYWQIANKFDLKNKLPDGFAIQGEIYGEGIQKNPHKVKGVEFRVFNVYDIQHGKYLDSRDAINFTEDLGLEFVFCFEVGNDGTLKNDTMESLLQNADQTGLEGLVFRPNNEVIDPKFGRVSFKVISNNYLLKN